jgi:Zn-dependent peptidase ImmA (M78 family)/transcriptional regulator with XRE-family HTH domain
MISGARVRQARELKKLTQQELAEQVDTSQSTIALIEGGQFIPNNLLVTRLALNLGFPPSFFRQNQSHEFPLGSLLYRAHASIPSIERSLAHRYAQLVFELSERMGNKLQVGPLRLPHVNENPKLAAQLARSSMGLSPDTPIAHVIRACEKAGVLVVVLPVAIEKLDAFSLWAGRKLTRPVIVLSGGKSGDRIRMSVAHELGHLVMHETLSQSMQDTERQAYEFAAEFLLPEQSIREELVSPITLTGLVPLKARWGVSLQALAMRAREMGMLSERQCRYLFEQMSQKGWRKREPKNLDVHVERPRALRQMAELVYGDPPDFSKMASDFQLTREFVMTLFDPYDSRHSEKKKEGPVPSRQKRVISIGADMTARQSQD